jgi:hypothetical protein
MPLICCHLNNLPVNNIKRKRQAITPYPAQSNGVAVAYLIDSSCASAICPADLSDRHTDHDIEFVTLDQAHNICFPLTVS